MIRDLLIHCGHALAERWREDPVHHAKRGLTALVVGLVVYNAAFAQEKRHDAPWFGSNETAALDAREETGNEAPSARRAAPADPVVFGIQSELMELGHYHGAIDGVTGSRTRAAIREYEISEGLAPTGEATGALLARIRLNAARDLPAPSMPARHPRDVRPSMGPVATNPIATDSIADVVATGSIGDETVPAVDLQAVQNALRRNGAAITADGVMGPNTRAAIESYRAARGLAPSGAVDATLIADLRAQGLL